MARDVDGNFEFLLPCSRPRPGSKNLGEEGGGSNFRLSTLCSPRVYSSSSGLSFSQGILLLLLASS